MEAPGNHILDVRGSEATTQPDALDRWLDLLVPKENCITPGPCIVLDTNFQYSFGCLQFQRATFVEQVRKYRFLPHAEDAELMNMIQDCDFQRTLARTMIQGDYSNWSRWKTSIRKIGMPPK